MQSIKDLIILFLLAFPLSSKLLISNKASNVNKFVFSENDHSNQNNTVAGENHMMKSLIKNIKNKLSANSVGLSLENSQIRDPPYKLKRCDQVVIVEGERFLNYEDYTKREVTYFEIAIYVINMFEDKDTETLIESIEFSHLKEIPGVIKGATSCLDINDKISNKRFPICLKSKETFDQIVEVFEDFMRCRKGDDLKGNLGRIITKLCQENRNNNNQKAQSQREGNNKIIDKLIGKVNLSPNGKLKLNKYYSLKPPGT